MPADPTIRAALDAAAKRLCICDGECFETRHGMMNGPCEAWPREAAAAVVAFHRKRATDFRILGMVPSAMLHDELAAAVEAAEGDA